MSALTRAMNFWRRDDPMKRGRSEATTLDQLGELKTSDGVALSTAPERARAYKKSIVLLLDAAAQREGLSPITVEAVVGASLTFRLHGGDRGKPAARLASAMAELIADALHITAVEVPRAEALAHFEARGAEHTLALVRTCMDAHIACFACDLGSAGRYLALSQGPLVAHTGLIAPDHFAIEPTADDGAFRMQHAVPALEDANALALAPKAEPVLMQAHAERRAWSKTALHRRSVTEVGRAICDGGTKALVQLSEGELRSRAALSRRAPALRSRAALPRCANTLHVRRSDWRSVARP